MLRLLVVLLLAGSCQPVVAQCALQFVAGDPIAGVDGDVHAMVEWDPDGAGPATPRIVIGGDFSAVADIAAENIAALDPATGTWTALGAGMSDVVFALAVSANGDLVAGGLFLQAGGV